MILRALLQKSAGLDPDPYLKGLARETTFYLPQSKEKHLYARLRSPEIDKLVHENIRKIKWLLAPFLFYKMTDPWSDAPTCMAYTFKKSTT